MYRKMVLLAFVFAFAAFVTAAKAGEKASTPSPVNGAICVPLDTMLSWTPGDFAESHDVYFGINFDDVSDASRANPLGVLVSQAQDPNSYNPVVLELCTTYYWRVDEVNDPNIWKGDVWSFKTCPCQICHCPILVESTFDVDDEGWEVYEGTTHYPTAIHWSATGGSPDGHVYSGDPGDGGFYFKAPAKFLGAMPCALNGTISRDLKTNIFDPNGRNMGLSIYGTDEQGGTIRISNSEHMNVINTWVTSTWTLNAAGGWTFIDAGGNISPASNANIIQVLQNVTNIHISGETVVGHSEVTRLDNVRITCGLPEEYRDDIKWSQPPVEKVGIINGWDELSIYYNELIIADDWMCRDERPIKDIHWWGSFKGWTKCAPPEKMPDAFHIGIWTDVPDLDPNDPNAFSHPNELVWEKICDCYVWSCAGCDLDPRGIDQNDACFKFDQLLSQDEWFYQDPEGGPESELTAGICDDFNLPTEDAMPSQEMIDYGPWQDTFGRDFDETGTDYIFGHTFTNLPPCTIVAAELEITMQPDATSGDPYNDLLALEFDSGAPVFPSVWHELISQLPLVPGGEPIGRWEIGDEPNTFILDLANLLPYQGVANILDHLRDGSLDVIVYDDTAVDCITLRVECASVYWLSIAAIYDGNTPEHPWGWKTRPHFYNDDAVRITDINDGAWPPVIGSVWESGEPIEYPEGTSWDMAFVLTTNRKYSPRKWHWPPVPLPLPDPPLPAPKYPVARADIYEDGEINFKDFAVIADYWLEEATFWP